MTPRQYLSITSDLIQFMDNNPEINDALETQARRDNNSTREWVADFANPHDNKRTHQVRVLIKTCACMGPARHHITLRATERKWIDGEPHLIPSDIRFELETDRRGYTAMWVNPNHSDDRQESNRWDIGYEILSTLNAASPNFLHVFSKTDHTLDETA